MHDQTSKKTLTKLVLEIGMDWVILLPIALFRVKNSPYQMGLAPFEIMFRAPLLLFPSSRLTSWWSWCAVQWAHKHA